MVALFKSVVRRWWPWSRIKRLRLALDAATDIGIYPKSVIGGDRPYEKRSDYMEGWNAAQLASLEAIIEQLEEGDW